MPRVVLSRPDSATRRRPQARQFIKAHTRRPPLLAPLFPQPSNSAHRSFQPSFRSLARPSSLHLSLHRTLQQALTVSAVATNPPTASFSYTVYYRPLLHEANSPPRQQRKETICRSEVSPPNTPKSTHTRRYDSRQLHYAAAQDDPHRRRHHCSFGRLGLAPSGSRRGRPPAHCRGESACVPVSQAFTAPTPQLTRRSVLAPSPPAAGTTGASSPHRGESPAYPARRA